ncbi:MAG: MBL fold metallo-hydrolase [Raoultibacter sp.]
MQQKGDMKPRDPEELPALTREYVESRRTRDASASTNTGKEKPYGADPLATAPGFVLHILASGSKGNAAIVRFGDTAILIDCGISKKEFLARCDIVGFDPTTLSAVLITHEHSDHTKGLGVVMRGLAKLDVRPALYTTNAIIAASAPIREIEPLVTLRRITTRQDFSVAGVRIMSFPTSHDSVESMGFHFESSKPNKNKIDTLGYVTDTGFLSDEARAMLKDCRLLALESNHDPHLLEIGPYPTALKRRVAGNEGHLSNEQAAKALEALLSNHLEQIAGMHLSETNNLPRSCETALADILARNNHPASMWAASQHRPLTLQ